MKDYEIYMRRAIELAEYGRGVVSPNPMVGCVIVYDNKIIGEGWHSSYGGAHAEVNAINDVKDKGLLSQSTLFVTLEPCSHWGKTPPCVDLVIQHQLKKVVICNVDTNPLVSGKGIAKLKNAGIEVETGILEKEGREINKRFFTFIEKNKPYVILKWAETADGFIAREDYSSKWISNETSRKLVHKWRSEEDSIMVGTRTALEDDPALNVRYWNGKNPIRIVLDRNLSLPKSLKLFDNSQKTLCYNNVVNQAEEYIQYIRLDYTFELIPQIINDLYKRKIHSVIVEGGSMVLKEFIKLEMWDEIRCFISSQTFGKGIKSPRFEGTLKEQINVQGDLLKIFYPNR